MWLQARVGLFCARRLNWYKEQLHSIETDQASIGAQRSSAHVACRMTAHAFLLVGPETGHRTSADVRLRARDAALRCVVELDLKLVLRTVCGMGLRYSYKPLSTRVIAADFVLDYHFRHFVTTENVFRGAPLPRTFTH